MLKSYCLLTVIIITGIWLTACGRIQQSRSQDEAIIIEMTVKPTQPQVGPANLVFTVTDKAGRPINDATLEVEGNMIHAGMSPISARATASEEGRYTTSLEWTMAGDWIVTVNVSLVDGQVVVHQFPVSVQKAAGQE
ncbi:MAG: hypothetical protein DPW09_35905 [Anaerolineae bacterium]|nr:hypothetical protein [Anaerolineae bacterium]